MIMKKMLFLFALLSYFVLFQMKGLPEFHPDAKFTGDVLSHLCKIQFISDLVLTK